MEMLNVDHSYSSPIDEDAMLSNGASEVRECFCDEESSRSGEIISWESVLLAVGLVLSFQDSTTNNFLQGKFAIRWCSNSIGCPTNSIFGIQGIRFLVP